MSADSGTIAQHPAPHRDRVSSAASAFALVAGPLAWFVQLCAGYSMATWPCFPKDQRNAYPLEGFGWTSQALTAALVIAAVIGFAAFLIAWLNYRRTSTEMAGDHLHLMEVGAGRTRFLALWGMLLGGGFCVVTLLTAVGFIVLPRCAG